MFPNLIEKAYAVNSADVISNPLGVSTIQELINKILDFVFALSIPVVTIMVIYAGFLILYAGEKTDGLKKGKDIILYASIGFGIILLSKGIAFVIQDILGFTGQ